MGKELDFAPVPVEIATLQVAYQNSTGLKSLSAADLELPRNLLRNSTDEYCELSVASIALNSRDGFNEMLSVIQPEHILSSNYRRLFELCKDAYNSTKDVNALAFVGGKTANDENLRKTFWDVASNYAPTANAVRFALLVREWFIRRELYQLCYNFPLKFDYQSDVFEMMEWLKKGLEQITPLDIQKKSNLDEELREHFEHSILDAGEKRKRLTPTGYNLLDDIFEGGFEAGDFVVIGARPSAGKTALGISLMMNMVARHVKCNFISLEMPNFQIIRRIISQKSEIPMGVLKGGTLSNEEASRLLVAQNYLSWLGEDNTMVLNDGSVTLSVLKNIIQENSRKGCKLFIIDYVQLVKPDAAVKGRNREQEIAEISRNLKSIAKENRIVIIALAQLNKGAADKTPQLETIRESEALIQDADSVMLLDRPSQRECVSIEFLGVETLTEGKGFLYIRKSRNGRTGAVKFNYIGEIGRFADDPAEMGGW